MALRDTIHQIQTRDSELSAVALDRDKFIADWIADLRSLYDLIESLLEDLIDDGVISVSVLNFRVTEDEIGDYEAPGLHLSIASKVVEVVPVARLTTGGAGRVDIYRRDRPSETERVLLVRRRNDAGEASWLIEKKWETVAPGVTGQGSTLAKLLGQSPRSYNALSKTALENALDYLLRNL